MPLSSATNALFRSVARTANTMSTASNAGPMQHTSYQDGNWPLSYASPSRTRAQSGISHRYPRGKTAEGPLTSAG